MPNYRLVIINGRAGIYRDGGGYVIDPRDTMFFNDEVEAEFKRMEASYARP